MMKRLLSTIAVSVLLAMTFSVFAAEKIDKTLDVAIQPTVNIEVIRGKVEVKTWHKTQVKVVGTLDEKSEGFTFERDGNSVTIKDELPNRLNKSNEKGSNLVVMIPMTANLDADGISTDFKLSQIKGDIDIETVSGRVEAANISGTTTLSSISGNIKTSKLDGKIKLEAVSGKVNDSESTGRVRYNLVSGNLISTSNATDIEAELVSGDIKATFLNVKKLEVKLVSGDASVKLSGDVERVSAESVSGDIELGFSTKPNASFVIDGGPGGEISNKLSNDKPKKRKYTGAESLSFSTGKATSSVKMSTISGEMTVRTR